MEIYLNRCKVDESFKLDALKHFETIRGTPLTCLQTQLEAEEAALRLAVLGPDVPWSDGTCIPASAISSLVTPAVAALRWAIWEQTGEAARYLRQVGSIQ
jgi:hypothetical protein